MSDETKKKIALCSNIVLVGASLWSLKDTTEHPLISSGLVLFALRGLFGIADHYGVDNENFKKAKEHLFLLTDQVGFPLLATDIMGCRCVRQEFKFLQLLGPLISYIYTETKEEPPTAIKELSHAMTAGGVIICAQQKTSYLATVLFPLPFVADTLVKEIAETEDYHDLCLALGVLFALLVVGEFV